MAGLCVALGIRSTLCGGVTIAEFEAMLDFAGSEEGTLLIEQSNLVSLLGRARSKLWVAVTDEQIAREKERCNTIGITLLVYTDVLFPAELSLLPESPLMLYVMGKGVFNYKRSVSVIGSRRCSSYGKDNARQIAADIAEQGGIVFSGLARGIDTLAHRGALDEKGSTIAVMGRGLAQIYPPENKLLAKEIVDSEKGLLVSEYCLDAPPRPHHFPRRNRLISALSRAVAVIEGGMRSGTLSTVNWALDQGREVFALPGRVEMPGSELAHHLIRDGATLMRSAQDILDTFTDWTVEPVEKESIPFPDDELGKRICTLLQEGELQSEALFSALDEPRPEVLARLTLLEIDSMVRKEVGSRYRLDSRLKS